MARDVQETALPTETPTCLVVSKTSLHHPVIDPRMRPTGKLASLGLIAADPDASIGVRGLMDPPSASEGPDQERRFRLQMRFFL